MNIGVPILAQYFIELVEFLRVGERSSDFCIVCDDFYSGKVLKFVQAPI